MKFTFFIAVLIISVNSFGQITLPSPSPSASINQKFGLAEIRVDYSRPSVKSRVIFGDKVPFGEIWRIGANSQTKFTTTDSLSIEKKGLSKGSYTLLAIPNKTAWEIIFNKNPITDYTNYKPSEDDVLTIKIPIESLTKNVETFSISINNITDTTCVMEISWEKTQVKFIIKNEVDAKIMAQIKQKLDGPTASEYQSMAQYYYDSNKDLKNAIEFIDKAILKNEGYGNLRLKALILAKSGDKKTAIDFATRSMMRAKKFNNIDYVRMNEKSIAEWSK